MCVCVCVCVCVGPYTCRFLGQRLIPIEAAISPSIFYYPTPQISNDVIVLFIISLNSYLC